MAETLTDRQTVLNRCAVSKIDLKGRFVFIDDRFEKMIGATKEELFGKPVSEFLDGESRAIVDEILLRRNHYETFFDTVQLTLQDCHNKPMRHRVVISLNFIGGNPVNYQFIILPEECEAVLPVSSEGNDFDALGELLQLRVEPELGRFSELLVRMSAVSQIVVYAAADSTLQPIASVMSPSIAAPKETPELTGMHFDLYNNGETYSCYDKSDIQQALEQYTAAPDECVRLIFDDEQVYLVRLLYEEGTNRKQIIKDCALCDLMISLVYGEPVDPQVSPDIKFTVGLLDSLRIPALLIDQEGTIVGYNPVMLDLVEQETLSGNYLRFLKGIETYMGESLYKRFLDHISSAVSDSDNGHFQFDLKLPHAGYYEVTLMKLSDQALDLTSCLIFLPKNGKVAEAQLKAMTPRKLPPLPNDESSFAHKAASVGKLLLQPYKESSVSLKDLLQEISDSYLSINPECQVNTVMKNLDLIESDVARWRLFLELVVALAQDLNGDAIELQMRGRKLKTEEFIELQLSTPKIAAIPMRYCRIFDYILEEVGWHLSIQIKESQKLYFILRKG